MAAPTPVARGTPVGIKLRDGFSSKITITGKTTISFWEKSVQPPALDGGPKIEQTTMFNTMRQDFAPQVLYEVTDIAVKAAYDPAVYTDIMSAINQPGTITITWRDGSTLADYGYLRAFRPDPLERGRQPEATVEFSFTGVDSTGVEFAPVITAVSGS